MSRTKASDSEPNREPDDDKSRPDRVWAKPVAAQPRHGEVERSAQSSDHTCHGEEDVDDEDLIEEIDLDEMPNFEGPDA